MIDLNQIGNVLCTKNLFHFFCQISSNENSVHDNRSKMLITLEVVAKVLDRLKGNDRLSIITFDTQTSIIQNMTLVSEMNLADLKKQIMKINSGGGTNMSAAIDCCSSIFDTNSIVGDTSYDNRILFLTDAQPNDGQLGQEHFYSRIEQLAKHRIYFSFIGVGIDLNTQLISSITKHRGANYFSVHDSKKFLKLLDEDFDLILTPLVFNVQMTFESDLFEIEQVYGSPEWDEKKSDQLMKINTLFPSRTDEDDNTRGGIVLLKLKTKKIIEEKINTTLHLTVNYEDRLGKHFQSKQLVYVHVNQDVYYGNLGIRKAILLVHYVTLLKKWIQDERERTFNQKRIGWSFYETDREKLSEWERQSTKLTVSKANRQEFQRFLQYFQSEMSVLQDKDLEQETKLMTKLIDYE